MYQPRVLHVYNETAQGARHDYSGLARQMTTSMACRKNGLAAIAATLPSAARNARSLRALGVRPMIEPFQRTARGAAERRGYRW